MKKQFIVLQLFIFLKYQKRYLFEYFNFYSISQEILKYGINIVINKFIDINSIEQAKKQSVMNLRK